MNSAFDLSFAKQGINCPANIMSGYDAFDFESVRIK
tara:strand:+ start:815 stop:922 length:108 start_codon:yes stop_codon:yes gene_type:complete